MKIQSLSMMVKVASVFLFTGFSAPAFGETLSELTLKALRMTNVLKDVCENSLVEKRVEPGTPVELKDPRDSVFESMRSTLDMEFGIAFRHQEFSAQSIAKALVRFVVHQDPVPIQDVISAERVIQGPERFPGLLPTLPSTNENADDHQRRLLKSVNDARLMIAFLTMLNVNLTEQMIQETRPASAERSLLYYESLLPVQAAVRHARIVHRATLNAYRITLSQEPLDNESDFLLPADRAKSNLMDESRRLSDHKN